MAWTGFLRETSTSNLEELWPGLAWPLEFWGVSAQLGWADSEAIHFFSQFYFFSQSGRQALVIWRNCGLAWPQALASPILGDLGSAGLGRF